MILLKGIISKATRIIHKKVNLETTAKVIEKYKVNLKI